MQHSPLLTRLWRAVSSFWLITPLVLWSGLVWLGQFILPQLPTPLVGNTLATETWLEKTAEASPGGQIAQVLGLFDLAHQAWVYGFVALFAFVLALRLFSRGYLAWSVRELAPPFTWLPLTNVADLEAPGWTQKESSRRLGERCSRQGATENGDNQESLWLADCYHQRVGPQMLIELGLLLLLIMLVWQLRTGWQWDDILLTPAQTVSLSPYARQTLQLDTQGEMFTFCCEPKRTVPLSDTRFYAAGYWLRVKQLIPAMQIQAYAADHPLLLQSLSEEGQVEKTLILQFPQARSERALAIPEENLVFVAVAQEDGGFQVQLRDAQNTSILTAEISEDKTLTWQDLVVDIHLTHAALVNVRHRTGSWLWLPAHLLFLIGLYVRWRWPYLRIGLRANEAGVTMRWQGQSHAHPSPPEIRQLFAARSKNDG